MIIILGAVLAGALALGLLVASFATSRGLEFTRPLGIFAAILAIALTVLYLVQ